MQEYLFAITFRPQTRPLAIGRINELMQSYGLLVKHVHQHDDTLYVVFISRAAITDFPTDERV